jgi:hypothetical protein
VGCEVEVIGVRSGEERGGGWGVGGGRVVWWREEREDL